MLEPSPTPLPSTAALSARLGKLSGRLLNLTRSNKTIRLLRKSSERHFDLCELLVLPDGAARVSKALDAILRGKHAVLTTARDVMTDEPAEARDDEEVELWSEYRDAEYDQAEQAKAKAKAAALAEAEAKALAELGTIPSPSTPTTTTTPTTPQTDLKDAQYVQDSEDEIAESDRPVIVRNWLRRRKIRGFERFDRNLLKLRGFTDSVETETGSQDLHLGWPFITGVCSDLDKTFLQAPLMLFPVRLVKDRVPQARWRVEAREDADPLFNETLARAIENYHKITFSEAFIEAADDQALTDPRSLPAFLAEALTTAGLTLSDQTFGEQPTMLPEYRSDEIPDGPEGVFTLHNHAVIGYFPQADSALRLDYEQMQSALAGGGELSGHVSMLLAALDGASDSGGSGDDQAPPLETGDIADKVSEKDQWFVLDTDSSQEEVLLAARRESRLVVHGPPGTGKSQVIVNLISDALKRGERVALVCQKRAALDVVFQRLDSIGLSRHVALVHDYAGDRRHLYQRIANTFSETPANASLALRELEDSITRLATHIDQCSERLGSLARELHAPRACGFTARQLYARLSAFPADQRTITAEATKLAPTLQRESLEELQRKLASLHAIHREIDTINHPWATRNSFASLGQADRQRIHDTLGAAITTCTAAQDVVASTPGVEIEPSTAIRAAALLRVTIEALEPVPPPVVSLAFSLMQGGFSAQQQAARALALSELAARLEGFQPRTAARPSIHCADGEILPTALVLETFAAHADKFFRFLNGDYRRAKPGAAAYLAKTGVLPSKAAAQEHAAYLRAANVWREIDTAWSVLPAEHFPSATTGGEVQLAGDQLAAASRVAAAIESARNGLAGALSDQVLPSAAGASESKATLMERLSRALAVAESLVKAQESLKGLAKWLPSERVVALGTKGLLPPRLAEGVLEGLRRGLDDFERLEAWDTVFASLTPEARAMVLALRAETTGKGVAEWREGVEPGVLGWWLDRIERDSPVLRDVTRKEAESLRTALATGLAERRVKMRELLAAELLHRALSPRFEPGRIVDRRHSAERPWRDLSYQVGKKSRHFSLRRLYGELGWPLMNLMPCWLVSPETMSAVFPNTPGVFDLVIFDEASQCPVEHGLPSAARGTRIVIAGDEQQLRPNDLFRSSGTEDDEEEADDGADTAATEAESLLTLARARYPGRMLMWHYRSKYEELIDFSNHGFYQARLKTIPDLSAVREPPPIEYVKVEGLWEDRRNRREAAAVVALLYDRLRDQWQHKTIGVVTFGVSQRVAIEEEIEHRRSMDEEFDAVFAKAFKPPSGRLDDALFVKNIENVQGDERDVIVFSVGYARDSRGRMVSNFGSLSQDGGENRLNVAVSRAREQIVVVASIEPTALNVANSLNRGPRLFRQYLEYARAVSAANADVQAAVLRDISGGMSRGNETVIAFDSPFEEQVHEALEKHNLVVRSQIGVSGYRIDLAVVDPADGSRYCLGIECDGATYHSAPSVRERDVYRQRALEMRGWKIHRIWSRNWWANQQAEIDKVLALVRGGGK